jgi:NAD(P)-dependent dehydrogenase (short-subunit alcohol dehydrogenase family)
MKRDCKAAIVTGAGQGLGAAIAARLAGDDFHVGIAEFDQALGAQAAERITGGGRSAVAHKTDVSDEASVKDLVEFTLNEYGRIDALVNNAGIYPKSPVIKMSKREWDRVLAVNLQGAFLCCKHVLPGMMARRSGRIINIASGHAVRGGAEFSHYAASKAGIVALTKSLALEVAPFGVLVNTVAPGVSDTTMPRIHSSEEEVRTKAEKMPMGRLTKPEEIADAVAYLLSERNTVITGQLFGVNGGQVLFGG